MKISFDTNTGTALMIYNDDMDIRDMGQAEIRRASHVEPGVDNKWYADMQPVGGAVLGPFTTRKEALEAEVAYLERTVI